MTTESEAVTFGACPTPASTYERIVMGHGAGGRLAADLLARIFLPAFDNEILAKLEDHATCALPGTSEHSLAFTTDAFVVNPIFFPGGDIGRLSICGTVNDLAMGGATPRFITAAFVLEEGLPVEDLERIVRSMRRACDEANVALVAGDTKVVERGKADKVFITTAGVGFLPRRRSLSVASASPGDRVVVSGTIGDHGIAILSVREGLAFETKLESDCAPLAGLASAMLEACPTVRCMRDPTRGGVSSVVTEIAAASRVGVKLDEASLPVRREVRAACEMLGLDPLYVANEGKLVAIVPAGDADRLVAAMRAHPHGRDAAVIGEIVDAHPGLVTVATIVGSERVVPVLAGEQLPRIC